MSLSNNARDLGLTAFRKPEVAKEILDAIDSPVPAAGSITSGMIADGAVVNADINASAAIAFSKLAALASTNILVGNGSNVAAAVAVSGDATLSNAGALTIANSAVTAAKIADAAITRTKQSAASGSKVVQHVGGTITTTGAVDEYIIAPEAGSLSSIEINPLVALTANDTNYITFTVVNLGQAGAGSTAMLAVSDANTTKATGGVGLAINTKRSLTVHGTAGNLVVAQGDKLKITATVSGTLANTVTVPVYCVRFSGTT